MYVCVQTTMQLYRHYSMTRNPFISVSPWSDPICPNYWDLINVLYLCPSVLCPLVHQKSKINESANLSKIGVIELIMDMPVMTEISMHAHSSLHTCKPADNGTICWPEGDKSERSIFLSNKENMLVMPEHTLLPKHTK